MYKELEYKKILVIGLVIYGIGSFITFDHEFVDSIIDFVLDLIMLTVVIFAFLWLKKKILLIGLILYVIAFNFGLLYNPLFVESPIYTYQPMSFLFKLDILAIIFLWTGLFDSKYFNSYSNLTPIPVISITIIGTVLFQTFVRFFG